MKKGEDESVINFKIMSLLICVIVVGSFEQGYRFKIYRPVIEEKINPVCKTRGEFSVLNSKDKDINLVIVLQHATRDRVSILYNISNRDSLFIRKKEKQFVRYSWDNIECVIGTRTDYGQKYYIHFLLVSSGQFKKIDKVINNSSKNKVYLFEKNFLNNSKNYLALVTVPVVRKIELLKNDFFMNRAFKNEALNKNLKGDSFGK